MMNKYSQKPLRGTRKFANILFFFVFLILNNILSAQKGGEWPNFHGSDRTNKSAETGLMKEWPADGPVLMFTIEGLGEGYSSVSIANGVIYTAGLLNQQTHVFAFDIKGKLLWKSPNGKAWSTTMAHAVTYTGSRSTPTYNSNRVYHLGESGRLAAFDAKTGKEIWYKDLAEQFEAPSTKYGFAESVLIDGNNLYVRPAGKKGFQVCLNKENGNIIWVNTEIPGVEGYTSPMIMEFGGYRQLIASSSLCYYSVDTKTGKLLWTADFKNERGLNISDVVISNDLVFMTSGYGKGSMLIKLKPSDGKINTETVWQSEIMDNHHGGVILHKGFLYGAGSNSRGWFCLDLITGTKKWNSEGKGSLTFADGMLYILEERSGSVKLVTATPEKYEQKGEFKAPKGGEGMYWAHPVVCGGRLYVRHADKIFVYDVNKK
ncbi:MAG: PQQ-like beta-propeller repeat protein [Bacteroidia bacterium]|nr:PQQ-like beta-propeller repeat protein [Bacteroidia bacterium]